MKKNTTYKIRLGMFISLGIVVLMIGIYFIGEQQQLFISTFRVSGVFNDVSGLQAGNNVRFSGINVGTVENISIVSDTSVRVEIIIDEHTRKFIKKDAFASIGSEGLMGNKVLIINPGVGNKIEIENNDIIKTLEPINMDNVFASLKSTLDNASVITDDLSKITNNIQSGQGAIGRLLMDEGLTQDFDSAFVSLKVGSSKFKVLMDKASIIDEILIALNSTVNNTSNITSDLAEITYNIQSGKGTIGRMLMDTSSVNNIDSTFINLKEGSAGFKVLMDKAKSSWLLWGF